MTERMGDKGKLLKYGWTGIIVVVFVLLIAFFLYFDRRNALSMFIRDWGIWGVILSILLMASLCMTPIPSEGLVILFLKVYGVYEGVFLAWLGSNISALAIYFIVRVHGQMIMKKLISPERFKVVDTWVMDRGSVGLLIARLLPIPAFAVNYIAGSMPSMNLWTYLWTAGISMIPYYVGTALVFLGVARETWKWLVLGVCALVAFWGLSFTLNRRKVI